MVAVEDLPVSPRVWDASFLPGDTWVHEVQVFSQTEATPADLTGWAFTVTAGDVAGTVDTSAAARGLLVLRFEASATATIVAGTPFALKGTRGADVKTFVAGSVTLSGGSPVLLGAPQRVVDARVSVFTGRRGDQGQDGPMGPQGPAGPQGPQGERGIAGPNTVPTAQIIAARALPLAGSSLPSARRAISLSRLNQAPARILIVSDSTLGAGVFSDSYTTATGSTNQGGPNCVASRLAKRLSASGLPALYAGGVPGHAGNLDARWTLGTGWIYQPLGAGNNSALSSSTPGAVLAYRPGEKADRYRILYAANAGTGQMKAQATGGVESGTFGSNPTASQYWSPVIAAASASADNVLSITSVSGTTFVTQVECWDSAEPNKVRILNAGCGSSKATQWASDLNHYARAITFIKATAPDLTIISLGINDMAAGDSVANVTSAISKIIAAAELSGDVLLVSGYPHPEPSSLDDLNEALRTANGVPARPYIDLFQRYGYDMVAQGFMTSDKTHPNAIGYDDTASVLQSFILAI